ncbi:MAG TPA: S9 family peptidase [Acidobacteriota bacterium]|nr:S9 family peptidase [Acidobacteriota bacterium]
MKKSLCFLFLIASVLLLAPLSSGAAEKKHFTVDDLLRVRRVSDPQLSPDGKWIAFTISELVWENNTRNSDIWLISSEGGEPRQLTHSPKRDDSPRWSPDGKQLAFISSRDGSPQVWLMGLDGGEPRKVTSIGTGADALVWSPDGQHLAFVSEIYPECSNDECNRKKSEQADKSKVKARVLDRLLFRHWNAWKEGKRSHIFVASVQGGDAKDLTPGDQDVPPFSLGGPTDYDFSPDGKELVFARNLDKMEATSTNSDLFIVPVTGGRARKITSNLGADNGPAYSPDGRFIAYRSQHTPGFESDRWEIALYDRKSGKNEIVPRSLDLSADSITWGTDSKKIYFSASENGQVPIYAYDLASQKTEKVLGGNFDHGDVSVSRNSQKLAFTRQTFNMPIEIFQSDIRGENVKQVTFVNRDFMQQFVMSEPESMTWKSKDGASIQGFLVKPPFFDARKKYPFLLLIHGGPQGAWSNAFSYRWNPQAIASRDYVVLLPNPRGSFGFGQEFTNEISGDWGGKVYDDLMAGVDQAAKLPYVNAACMGAAGGSYGGYMVNWIEGHTDRFKALVSHAGVFNLTSMYGVTEELWFPEWELKGTPWTNREMYDRWSPHNFVHNFKTPLLVIHGELDYRVPIGEGFQLFTSLQRMNVASKMLYFPDEGHWVLKPQNSKLWYDTFLNWFDRWLKK